MSQQQISNITTSNTDQWFTPQYIIDLVDDVMGGIDLDPCSTFNNRTNAAQFFTVKDDGLLQKWSGKVFMNPPYGNPTTANWCYYLIDQNPDEAMILIRNSTGSNYYQSLSDWCDAKCFFSGRIDFMAGEGQKISKATFSSVMFYKGPNVERFKRMFATQGRIVSLNNTLRDQRLKNAISKRKRDKQISTLHIKGKSMIDIALKLNINRSTVYRVLQKC